MFENIATGIFSPEILEALKCDVKINGQFWTSLIIMYGGPANMGRGQGAKFFANRGGCCANGHSTFQVSQILSHSTFYTLVQGLV